MLKQFNEELNGVSVVTAAEVPDSYAGSTIQLELSNASENSYVAQASNIAINGIIVSPAGAWSRVALLPQKNGLLSISLDYLIDQEIMEELGITEINNITMDLSLADSNLETIATGGEKALFGKRSDVAFDVYCEEDK